MHDMASIKRPHSPYGEMASKSGNPFMSMFESFRTQLDEHHDRRERIVKTSRDVTGMSKKIIFALQRYAILPMNQLTPASSSLNMRSLLSMPKLHEPLPESIERTIAPFQKQIDTLFTSISPDLLSINYYRYSRQISPGIQEYVEALSFRQYLLTQTIVTYQQAQASFSAGILLTEDDYLLGLCDMTGELMRFAITGMATGGMLPGSENEAEGGKGTILSNLRSLRMGFEGLDLQGSGLRREAEKKVEVMRQSVEKVEAAVYGLVVRGSERPTGWIPDFGGDGERREVVEIY